MTNIREDKLSSLTQDESNANTGTDRGKRMLETSLKEYGAGRSILLDKAGRIIGGNKTQLAGQAIGIEDVIIVQTDGTKLVAVQRMDLDLENDTKARELAYLDNRVSEIDLSWNTDQLKSDLAEGVDLSLFWTTDEINALLVTTDTQTEGAGGDDVPAPSSVPTRCQPGDIWQLGKHRLAIGSSTDAALVQRLFEGELFRVMWTDPPYGVSYADKNAILNKSGKGNHVQTEIQNDHMSEEQTETLAREAFTLAVRYGMAGAAAYIAVPARFIHRFIVAMNDSGFAYKHQLVWVKNNLVLGQADYHYKHEPILYGWLTNGPHYFTSERTHTTVFEANKPTCSDLHPTTKPIELILPMVENSSQRDEIVYDPFCGSGSTLIAAERLKRRCFACELSETYGDVILTRYTSETGTEPVLIERLPC